MKCISRLIVLVIVSSGDVESSYVREGQRSLIVGGVTVDADKYPYIAHVGDCGAVLVAKNIFLTAAHCETPFRVVVNKVSLSSSDRGRKLSRAGRHFHEERSTFQVTDSISHPKWGKSMKPNSYDFKLIRVSGFSDEQPIDLDNVNNGYTNTGELLTIMGWGKTGVDKESSVDLLEADVDVIDFQTCNEKYDEKLDETLMFCAGKSSGGTYRTTCQG